VRCRVIAAAFICVWLILLAGDFGDDLGLFDNDDDAVDQALDGALADLGQAIDIHHSDTATWLVAHDSSGAATPVMLPSAFFRNETSAFTLLRIAPRPQPTIFHSERSSVLLL